MSSVEKMPESFFKTIATVVFSRGRHWSGMLQHLERVFWLPVFLSHLSSVPPNWQRHMPKASKKFHPLFTLLSSVSGRILREFANSPAHPRLLKFRKRSKKKMNHKDHETVRPCQEDTVNPEKQELHDTVPEKKRWSWGSIGPDVNCEKAGRFLCWLVLHCEFNSTKIYRKKSRMLRWISWSWMKVSEHPGKCGERLMRTTERNLLSTVFTEHLGLGEAVEK